MNRQYNVRSHHNSSHIQAEREMIRVQQQPIKPSGTLKHRMQDSASARPWSAEIYEKLEMSFQELLQRSREGAVILVEGPKDATALRAKGIEGQIVCVKANRGTVVDIIQPLIHTSREIIILMDFDRRGRQLAGRITHYLQSKGVNPNLRIWLKIHGLVSNQTKDIEGLVTYIENIKTTLGK